MYIRETGGEIFACFIDVRNAFDSIWHNGLFYHILECGVGGKVYDLIKTMYLDNKSSIKIKDRRTDFFYTRTWCEAGLHFKSNTFQYLY